MLPIVLVLCVASSAFAAPSVQVNQVSINDVTPRQSNGRLVSAALSDRAFEIVDGGDTNVYIATVVNIINDVANQNDPQTQALAVGQTIAVLSALANGVPGDACAAANAIDAYTRNPGSSRGAVANLLQSLASSIDSIVQLADNPNAARYSSGSRGNCNGGGRTYSFEAAWDSILSNASPSSAGLINEQYCAAKRLYNAVNIRSNIAGAYLTAFSLPSVNQALVREIGPLARFATALGNGSAASAAGAAKQALRRAANSV